MDDGIMRKKKDTIRVGDMVKIVDPLFYVRCGYDYELPEAVNEIVEVHGKEIKSLLESVGLDYNGLDDDFLKYDKIVQELAYRKVSKMRYRKASPRRQLFTEYVPRFKGVQSVVSDKFMVKTGVYSPASGGGYYDDYDPAYLSQEKTHRIVRLQLFDAEFVDTRRGRVLLDHIEAVHLEKVECGKNSSVSFFSSP